MNKLSKKEQITILKIKSLLNHLDYLIKPEHQPLISEFHKLCRKYAKI
jgi:hypothetical protein